MLEKMTSRKVLVGLPEVMLEEIDRRARQDSATRCEFLRDLIRKGLKSRMIQEAGFRQPPVEA